MYMMTIIILNTFWPAVERVGREQSIFYAYKYIQMHATTAIVDDRRNEITYLAFCSKDPSNKVKHIINESGQTKKSYIVNFINAY